MFYVLEPLETVGSRLDEVLSHRLPGLSKRQAGRLCQRGMVRDESSGLGKSGTVLSKGSRITTPTRVWIDLEKAGIDDRGFPVLTARPPLPKEDIPIWMDTHLVSVNKPRGLACHANHPGQQNTLINRILSLIPEHPRAGWPVPLEAGLLNRIDTYTSGLVLLARDPREFPVLARAVRTESRKKYLLLVCGCPEWDSLGCSAPIHTRGGKRVRVVPDCTADGVSEDGPPAGSKRPEAAGGKRSAQTEFRVLARNTARSIALVSAELSRGQMHQVRAHAAFLGHPLVGDGLYGGRTDLTWDHGGETKPVIRHILHARSVCLRIPKFYPEELELTAEIPGYFRKLLATYFPDVPDLNA